MKHHDTIKEKIGALIDNLGLASTDIVVSYDEDTNTLWFSLPRESTRLLLARGGEALGALNHLATKIVEQITKDEDETVKRLRVIIDSGDTERKKIDNLKTIAHMMAERARYFKSSISVDPMPAYERRIIHEHLSAMPDIITESEGMGKNRHIVIKYRDPQI